MLKASPAEPHSREEASWHALPRGAYKSSILAKLLLLSPITSGGRRILREEKQSAAGAGHNKKERQGDTGGYVLPARLGTQTMQGAESAVTVKGSTSLTQHVRAYNRSITSCIITCHQLEQGGPETKNINIQCISFLSLSASNSPRQERGKYWCGGAGNTTSEQSVRRTGHTS